MVSCLSRSGLMEAFFETGIAPLQRFRQVVSNEQGQEVPITHVDWARPMPDAANAAPIPPPPPDLPPPMKEDVDFFFHSRFLVPPVEMIDAVSEMPPSPSEGSDRSCWVVVRVRVFSGGAEVVDPFFACCGTMLIEVLEGALASFLPRERSTVDVPETERFVPFPFPSM